MLVIPDWIIKSDINGLDGHCHSIVAVDLGSRKRDAAADFYIALQQ